MSTKTKRVLLTQPEDDTLEAFKKCVTEIYTHLTGKTGDDGSITEEQWQELHRKFLGKDEPK